MYVQVYITALSKTNATKLNEDVLENEVNWKKSLIYYLTLLLGATPFAPQ